MIGLLALVLAVAQGDQQPASPRWDFENRQQLATVIGDVTADGLRPQDYAMTEGLDDEGTSRVALRLAHDLFEGRGDEGRATDWHITRPAVDYAGWLQTALTLHQVQTRFRALRPKAPAYAALSAALTNCSPAARCETLRINLDRWRRLPRQLGARYLWVNAPAYRVDLVDQGAAVESHRVIVGKPGSPTPVFRAAVTGITANPWWNVPCTIVNNEIGKLIRANPAVATARGYVWNVDAKGQLVVRQRPGPQNALGQIKLEMPNPYSVYLHDTPSRKLFDRDQRALSHGCVRTQDPVSLAKQLLTAEQNEALDVALLSGVNKTFPVRPAMPIYVVYFTAEPDGKGGIVYYPDLYNRDGPSN